MEQHGNAYRVFLVVDKFCNELEKNKFQICEQSNGHVIQISSYNSPYVIGKIFERDILVIYNGNDKNSKDAKKEASRLETLAKNFPHKIKID